jgi:hypothetical protein
MASFATGSRRKGRSLKGAAKPTVGGAIMEGHARAPFFEFIMNFQKSCTFSLFAMRWKDLNLRPLGYEGNPPTD